jgi:ribonucleoside-diphosphate reductase alpha chain
MTVEKWLENNQLALDIWHKKYQQNNETFDEWVDRISNKTPEIKNLILNKKFLYGGRILASRGLKDRKVTYSNCYVISPPEDSIESIFETGSKLARTYSYGGGCGIDISNLRPKGAIVHNAAKSTSGAVSFMDFYSYITGLIGQSGRRGKP